MSVPLAGRRYGTFQDVPLGKSLYLHQAAATQTNAKSSLRTRPVLCAAEVEPIALTLLPPHFRRP